MTSGNWIVDLMVTLAELAGIPPGPPDTVIPALIERGLIHQTVENEQTFISVTDKGEKLLSRPRH